MIIEAFLVVSVVTFNLTVMAWCAWTDPFMADFQLFTQNIEWMYTFGFLNMCKFSTIVSLKYISLVSKVKDGTFQKIRS